MKTMLGRLPAAAPDFLGGFDIARTAEVPPAIRPPATQDLKKCRRLIRDTSLE
jgi:hypothetical protein